MRCYASRASSRQHSVTPICETYRSYPILSRAPPRFLLDTQRIGSVSALQQVAESARIVVCTALTASRHSLLNIKFDWCIVDEAGQINQPTILGPLMKAERYDIACTNKHSYRAIARTAASAVAFHVAVTSSSFNHLVRHPRSILHLPFTPLTRFSTLLLPSQSPCSSTSSFVLVGDDYQLPPIIISSEAQARGMDVSLLKRLLEAHPEAATCLTAQYRMNEQIMSLCNTLIYEDRMTCATSSVASARLTIRNFPPTRDISNDGKLIDDYTANVIGGGLPSGLITVDSWGIEKSKQRLDSEDTWLLHCLNPEHSVVFLNTDSMYTHQLSAPGGGATSILKGGPSTEPIDPNSHGSRPDFKGTNVHLAEVTVVCRIVQGLEKCGFNVRKGGGLGVISPFRAQVAAIKDALTAFSVKKSAAETSAVSAAAPSSSAMNVSTSGVYQAASGQGGRTSRTAVLESKGCDEAETECEVSTVDSFQGRDMDAVIFSTVKNLQEGSVSGLHVLTFSVDIAALIA
jgi:AAA domain